MFLLITALGICALSGIGSTVGSKIAKKVVGRSIYQEWRSSRLCQVETDG